MSGWYSAYFPPIPVSAFSSKKQRHGSGRCFSVTIRSISLGYSLYLGELSLKSLHLSLQLCDLLFLLCDRLCRCSRSLYSLLRCGCLLCNDCFFAALFFTPALAGVAAFFAGAFFAALVFFAVLVFFAAALVAGVFFVAIFTLLVMMSR